MKLLFLILFSIILIQKNHQDKSLRFKYKKSKTPNWIKKHKTIAITPWQYEFFKASSLGIKNKRGFKKEYQKIKNLNLFHLLTPSGLHFSLFLFPLLKLPIHFLLPILIILFGLSFYSSGFLSIKRILLYKIIRSFNQILNLNLSRLHTLILTMLIDILFGTFQISPISFCLSFIFLIIFVQLNEIQSLPLPFSIGFANYFIAYVFQTPFTIFIPISSLIISFFFMPYFFFNIFFTLLPTRFFARLHYLIHSLFQIIIEYADLLNTYFTRWIPSFTEILLVMVFLLSRKKIRRIAFIFTILLMILN